MGKVASVIESLTAGTCWPRKSRMIWREHFKEKKCQTFWAKKVLGKLNQVLKEKDLEEFNQVLRGGAEELENSDAQGTACAQKYLIRKFAAS